MQQMQSIAGMYVKRLLYNHNEKSQKESHYKLWRNYYGTYNALQMYDHNASTGLLYSTF